MWLYWKLIRVEVRGGDALRQRVEHDGCIFLMWHDSLCMVPLFEWVAKVRPLYIFISKSRDGDIPTALGLQYENVFVVRVGHTSRAQALSEGCRLLNERMCLLMTPDGPRGPWRKIKPGAIYASMKSGKSIIPLVFAASREACFSTKDRLRLPKPFSKVIIEVLEPIFCSEDRSREEWQESIEVKMELAERQLRDELSGKKAQESEQGLR
jgi:lysophospholipid acyltransferase (LPLAT)-like uncharacterized protein